MTKKLILLFSIVYIFLIGCEKKLPPHTLVRFNPEQPRHGNILTINYTPGINSPLAKADSVILQALLVPCNPTSREILEKGRMKEIPMQQRGIHWSATLNPDSSTGCIVMEFRSGDKFDNNNKQGWDVLIYNTNGQPVRGAYSALSQVYGDGIVSFLMDLKKFNLDTALQLYAKETSLYPDNWRARAVSLNLRYGQALKKNDKESINHLSSEIKTYINEHPTDIKILELAYTFFYRTDPVQAEKVLKRIKTLDPNHRYVISKKIKKIRNIRNLREQLKQLSALQEEIEGTDSYYTWANYMFEDLTALQKWDRIIKLGEDFIRKLDSAPPTYPSYSKAKMKKQKQSKLYLPLKTLAIAYHKLGKDAKAEQCYLRLNRLNLYPHQKVEFLEDYIQFLIDRKEWQKASETALNAIKTAHFSEKIENLFKIAYGNATGDEKGAEELLIKAKKESGIYRKQELARTMIADPKPAPNFTLTNLKGQEISLSDLRGKIVILDFWATWCSPCKASFPYLQKFWEQHKNNPEVVLFAINTKEQVRGHERKRRILTYLKKMDLTFPVLLDDTENSVMKLYEVGSIPTKFFIGPDGKIYFKEVGFHGPTMVEDMNIQIELIKEKLPAYF